MTKEERRLYQKAYRLANRDKLNANNRIYGKAHRKENKIYLKTYKETHGDAMRARRHAYYIAHREGELAKHKAYYLAHAVQLKAYAISYRAATRNQKRITSIEKKYGLTEAAFRSMLLDQGGGCAVCQRIDWNSKGPCVDHDHATGRVRGILCSNCNSAAGLLGEDPARAMKLAAYLEPERRMNSGRVA
jgi:hypothetical protein